MKNMISAVALLLTFSACGGDNKKQDTPDVNVIGANLLDEARAKLATCDYNGARECIMKLRVDYPTAIAARKQGILLLDSIEMQAAADSVQYAEGEEWERLDTKARFYQRKLQEDLKR